MENKVEIDLNECIESKTENVQLPVNFITVGQIENDDVKVYIKQDVYKELEKYASEDTSKEVGTIIVGEYSEELDKTHVIISDYIEAKYTEASASTLTFTHETWNYVYKEHDEKYPNKKIVGWQHTHPNYGIFLSNYDMFIQENFFNLPFQVAYVIDPIQNIRGFFQWKNGKVEKLKGFYIYDDIGKPIKIEQTKVKKEEKVNKVEKILPKYIYTVIALLIIATLGLGIKVISYSNKYKEQERNQEKIVAKIQEQEKDIAELQNKITSKEIGKNKDITTVDFITYTVKRGDTLLKICKENGIDYKLNKKMILSLNGIENPNKISVGQKILIPIEK